MGKRPHSIAEQRAITDGRVIPVGKEGFIRKPPKRVDYLLRYTRDFPIAVAEAKASYKTATDAVQQARLYTEMLDLQFAYATNVTGIIETDYFTGTENKFPAFPSRTTYGTAIRWEAELRAREGRDDPTAYELIQVEIVSIHAPARGATAPVLTEGKQRSLHAHYRVSAKGGVEACATLVTFWGISTLAVMRAGGTRCGKCRLEDQRALRVEN